LKRMDFDFDRKKESPTLTLKEKEEGRRAPGAYLGFSPPLSPPPFVRKENRCHTVRGNNRRRKRRGSYLGSARPLTTAGRAMGSGSEKTWSRGLQSTTAISLDGAARSSGRTRAPARGTTAAPSPSPDPVTLSSSIGGGGCAALGAERRGGSRERRGGRQPGLLWHHSPSPAQTAKVAADAALPRAALERDREESK
jgi:hypothetical protein